MARSAGSDLTFSRLPFAVEVALQQPACMGHLTTPVNTDAEERTREDLVQLPVMTPRIEHASDGFPVVEHADVRKLKC
ncbi:hypothetical protein PUN4_560057 [Paraburkholderia unamae]|nr:hypothetical protein PUN4_560057 [Paraburkholderia unamae]